MAKKFGGLGKGLNAIFVENETENKNSVVTLKLSQIEPNRYQPRKHFEAEAIDTLAESIMEHGVLQPIVVRPLLTGGYQIVAGERRYRASMNIGLKEIPAVIRDLDDKETLQLAMIENLQREDLTPLEEARGLDALMDEYDLTQEQVANMVGKSRSAVANTLRLLSLPCEVRFMLEEGVITAGHARALLGMENENFIEEVADIVVKKELSVRDTEKLVKKYNIELADEDDERKKKRVKQPTVFKEVELSLEEALGTKVRVKKGKTEEGGTLCIEFYNPDDLFRLANKLGK